MDQFYGKRFYDEPLKATNKNDLSQLSDIVLRGFNEQSSQGAVEKHHQQQGIIPNVDYNMSTNTSQTIFQNPLMIGNQQDANLHLMLNNNGGNGASFQNFITGGNQGVQNFDPMMLQNNANIHPVSMENANMCNGNRADLEPLNIQESHLLENRRRGSLAMLSSMFGDIGTNNPGISRRDSLSLPREAFRRSSMQMFQSMVADGDLDFGDLEQLQYNQNQYEGSTSPLKTFRRASLALMNSAMLDGDVNFLPDRKNEQYQSQQDDSNTNTNLKGGIHRRGSLFLVDQLLQDMEQNAPPTVSAPGAPTHLSLESSNHSQVGAGVAHVMPTTLMATNTKALAVQMNRTYEDNLKALQNAVLISQKSENDINEWDIRMGLKKSHSKLMIKSAKSRKRILTSLKKQLKKNARDQLKFKARHQWMMPNGTKLPSPVPKRKVPPKKRKSKAANKKN
mmetsp:Transcript_9787/g.15031  ORF Transcript_9787/g.15031 Transcript_9787/m.15031 type:complete len:450 (+) Transcript_9787:81-1430(+)